jgi:hypothetical protein
MANEIKFTEEEVKQINELRINASQIFTQLGQISIEKDRRNKQHEQSLQELQTAEAELYKKHTELSTSEQNLFKTLNEKYGDGNYDPETGVFTPIEKSEKEV